MWQPTLKSIQKQLPKLLELNNIVFIIAIGVALSLIWNTVAAIDKNFNLQTRVDGLSEEVSLLDLENQNLSLGNDYYRTDAYLELAARDKLGLVAAGEKVLVLPDYSDLATQAAATDAQSQNQEEVTNLDQWLYFLFRREP